MDSKDTKQDSDIGQSFYERLKEKTKKYALIYYPIHYAKLPWYWIRQKVWYQMKPALGWQIRKACTRFNTDGLNRPERKKPRIIASITTYPGRIKLVLYVIAAILNPTMKPDKIILWLGEDKFPGGKLPEIFDKVKKCGVNIEFREDIGPHTKYFHAMKEYPDDIVITFDDDQIYNHDVIEVLYKSYIKSPGTIHCIGVDEIAFTTECEIASYQYWPRHRGIIGRSSHDYMPLGVFGALYPPHSVSDEVFNIEAIRKLTPKNDDIWLKFMALLKGTKITRVGYNGRTNPSGVPAYTIFRSQLEGLYRENDRGGGNDRQFKAVLDAYNTYLPGKTLLEIMRGDVDGVK